MMCDRVAVPGDGAMGWVDCGTATQGKLVTAYFRFALPAAIAALIIAGCKGPESSTRPSAYGFADQAATVGNGGTVPQPARSAGSEITTGTHVVEFRARTGPDIIGHSYIVYGKQAKDGSIAEATQVGLYPKDVTGFAFGIIGADARTEPVGLDMSIPPSVVYRRALTEEEYSRLAAAVERARADPPTWSWTGYNCNTFVADLAREIGLKTPAGATLMAPGIMVSQLKSLNG